MTQLVVHEQTEHIASQGHGYYRVTYPFAINTDLSIKIINFVGESTDDNLPIYRDRRCFVFEAVIAWKHEEPKWYIGCDDMWHRKKWGDVEGPFDTPDQAWTWLKLLSEHE